jgi:hypothetical protein
MTRDEHGTARLRFADEPAAGRVTEADLDAPFPVVLRGAEVPHLVAVMPRVARAPLVPETDESRAWTDSELALPAPLRDDGVAFACHGLDHRTRHRHPRRHSELCGLDPNALRERLDPAAAIPDHASIDAPTSVVPDNRFDPGQWDALAARCAVMTGGPESVARRGDLKRLAAHVAGRARPWGDLYDAVQASAA